MVRSGAGGHAHRMIRVLVVDDHPAVRAGLEAVLRTEPGIAVVASCGAIEDARTSIERTEPDVAVVDYELGDGHGLELCLEFYAHGLRTLVYSAYSERVLAAASMLAGAGGLLHKSAEAAELCDAIRSVARDIPLFPPVTRDVLEVCAQRLDTEDLPILGMLVEGTPRPDVAEVLRISDDELGRRVAGMVQRLRPATGALRRLPGAV